MADKRWVFLIGGPGHGRMIPDDGYPSVRIPSFREQVPREEVYNRVETPEGRQIRILYAHESLTSVEAIEQYRTYLTLT
jgi:hypothetical protein